MKESLASASIELFMKLNSLSQIFFTIIITLFKMSKNLFEHEIFSNAVRVIIQVTEASCR